MEMNRRIVDNCGLSTDLLTLSTKMGYGSVENASGENTNYVNHIL